MAYPHERDTERDAQVDVSYRADTVSSPPGGEPHFVIEPASAGERDFSTGDREAEYEAQQQVFFAELERYSVRPLAVLPAFRLIRQMAPGESLFEKLAAGRQLLRIWSQREEWCRELLKATRHSTRRFIETGEEVVREMAATPVMGSLPLNLLNSVHVDVGLLQRFTREGSAAHMLLEGLVRAQLSFEVARRENDLTRRDQHQQALSFLLCDWSLLALHGGLQKIPAKGWSEYQRRHAQISAAMLVSAEEVTPRMRSWISGHHAAGQSANETLIRSDAASTNGSISSASLVGPGFDRFLALMRICETTFQAANKTFDRNPWREGIRGAWKEVLRGRLSRDIVRMIASHLAPELLGELRTISLEGRHFRVDAGQRGAALLAGPHWLSRKALARRHAGLDAMRKWKRQSSVVREAGRS